MNTPTRSFEEVIIDALNTAYNELGRDHADLVEDPGLFAANVETIARLWANTCLDVDDPDTQL